jgi:hypothetical protein
MATTTGGTTYVTSTDLVANYPTASLALANRVDVVASGGPGLVKTSGYTITVADILGGNKFLYNSASPGTFILPTSSLVDGMVVNVAQIGAGALTVSGGTIVGTTVTTAQYQGLSFVYVASGTTWYSIAPNVTAPGLAIVSPTSIANSGGSASASGGAITCTGVTSVSLNGIFSSAYDNYLCILAVTQTSSDDINARLRVGGVDNTTASSYITNLLNVTGATVGGATTTTTSWSFAAADSNPTTVSNVVSSPFLAAKTGWEGSTARGDRITLRGGYHTATSSFDGLTLIANTGNFTGTVRIYGFKNS